MCEEPVMTIEPEEEDVAPKAKSYVRATGEYIPPDSPKQSISPPSEKIETIVPKLHDQFKKVTQATDEIDLLLDNTPPSSPIPALPEKKVVPIVEPIEPVTSETVGQIEPPVSEDPSSIPSSIPSWEVKEDSPDKALTVSDGSVSSPNPVEEKE